MLPGRNCHLKVMGCCLSPCVCLRASDLLIDGPGIALVCACNTVSIAELSNHHILRPRHVIGVADLHKSYVINVIGQMSHYAIRMIHDGHAHDCGRARLPVAVRHDFDESHDNASRHPPYIG
jgi:hypothetical protein